MASKAAGLKDKLCEACRDECSGRDRREEMSRRAPSTNRELPGPKPNKESTAEGEKKKPTVVVTSRDGASASVPGKPTDAPVLQLYSDHRMTKLVTTGGPTSLCYQLYTEGGVATWKQTAVPNNGHSGVLLMPVKRMPHPDRVDMKAQAWQSSTWPPAREVVLSTDRATGRQTVRMRFQTNGEEQSARNEGLALFAAQRPGGAVGRGEQSSKAGLAKEPEKPKEPEKKDEAE